MPCSSWIPPVVLDGVKALCEANFLAREVFPPVDVVPGAHHHAAAFVYMGRPKKLGPTDVRVNVNRGEQTAEAMMAIGTHRVRSRKTR
ncbi:MAG: hypothetical protein ACXVI7_06710 [Halobacteriota archaeon]